MGWNLVEANKILLGVFKENFLNRLVKCQDHFYSSFTLYIIEFVKFLHILTF